MADDLLSFKDFPPIHGAGLNSGSNHNQNSAPPQISVNSPTHNSSNRVGDPLLDLINDMTNSVNILNTGGNSSGNLDPNFSNNDEDNVKQKVTVSPLNIEFYQRYFNVDTLMVIDRIVSSMIPKRAPSNYLKSHIGLNPDLYGPFWIAVTLIFSIAISGNIADYLQTANQNYTWKYNFHLVSYAATAIYIYAFFIPIGIWAVFKWSLKPVDDDDLEADTAAYTPTLLSLVCVYGYSLSIYIPVSILWVIPISFLQWLLVLTAAFLSGSVLILILTPALRNSKFSLFIIIGVLLAHFLLAAGFMLYFFHIPSTLPEAVTEGVKKVTESVKTLGAKATVERT